jgi:ornithine--oxo-acid transaminase
VPFGDAHAIEQAIDEATVAVLIEPIQGEAGVIVPPEGYLSEIRKICSYAGVLLIFDEIQTGFCRTGRRFAWHYEDARPDIMCVGKALGGGILPISAILADDAIMHVFTPGTHGSTFGGNPLAAAVGPAALEVLEKEQLDVRAFRLGEKFRSALQAANLPNIRLIRGKGLLNAVVFPENFDAFPTCLSLKEKGILAKQTHGNIIRFAPPLIMSDEEMEDALEKIIAALRNE